MEFGEASPLPDLSHLKRADYDNVYEPSDDTYLFVDTLYSEREYLVNLKPTICVEVGGGSGCVSAALSQVLLPDVKTFHLVTDINPIASATCKRTLRQNKVEMEDELVTDLLGGLEKRLVGNIDVFMFNPPYVVTPPEEIESSLIARSWAGGEFGRQVLDKLLPILPSLISERGCIYLIAIEENKPDEICALLKEYGMTDAKVSIFVIKSYDLN